MLYCLGEGTKRTQADFDCFLNKPNEPKKTLYLFIDRNQGRFCIKGGFTQWGIAILGYIRQTYAWHAELNESWNKLKYKAMYTGNTAVRTSAIVRWICDHAEQLGMDVSNVYIGYAERFETMQGERFGKLYLYYGTERVEAGGYYNHLIPSLLQDVERRFHPDWTDLPRRGRKYFIGNEDFSPADEGSCTVGDGYEIAWNYSANTSDLNRSNCIAILEQLAEMTEGMQKEKYGIVYSLPGWTLDHYADVSDSVAAPVPMPSTYIAARYLEPHLQRSRKPIILTGAPGTGKTYSARKYVTALTGEAEAGMHWDFVQFHSSYDYTDFVEGLRPVALGNPPQTTFVRLDGTFKAFCRRAAAVPEERFYFIIDEINRADLSRVFGELMFCLEATHRGETERVQTQCRNLPTYEIDENGTPTVMEEDVFRAGFYIPENVIIIGTMNDIDRSVESFDFALRRRFHWEEVKAEEVMAATLTAMLAEQELLSDDALQALLGRISALNQTISSEGKRYGLNDAYHIGPSYFADFGAETDAGTYFDAELRSILMQYVLGRNDADEFVKKCREAFTQ